MIPFSRSFMRKRAIQLATTALVAATSFALAQDPMKVFHVRGAMPIQYVADRPDYAAEGPFLAENDAAMSKMMADMTIKPTGDIDRDFVAMMAPHHQGRSRWRRPNSNTAITNGSAAWPRKSS